MIEDKIALLIKDISKEREELKEIRKDIKNEEKIETEEYDELKKALKDLKEQVKTYEEEFKQSLNDDEHFRKLREMRLEQEEKIANLNASLLKFLEDLPKKSFQMNVETEQGTLIARFEPNMKLYINGKEQKITAI